MVILWQKLKKKTEYSEWMSEIISHNVCKCAKMHKIWKFLNAGNAKLNALHNFSLLSFLPLYLHHPVCQKCQINHKLGNEPAIN